MKQITYDEFLRMIKLEKVINISDMEEVIGQILKMESVDDEVLNDTSPHEKLKKLGCLFGKKDIQVYGTVDEIHNCAVSYARQNMYDYACEILKCGLEISEAAVDLLADYVRYGISCGRHEECTKYYEQMQRIPKDQWNWRAFSFSIDYLLAEFKRFLDEEKRNNLRKAAEEMADEFIEKIGNDQAYFDKAQILREFGRSELETEESVLRKGLEILKVAPKCALRMADILFEKGEYQEAAELLKRCSINAFKPQPDINGSYSFLLSALSKTSNLFIQQKDGNFMDCKDTVMNIFKDFNTAIKSGLDEAYRETANVAIKILEAQTDYEYPYTNSTDLYDF